MISMARQLVHEELMKIAGHCLAQKDENAIYFCCVMDLFIGNLADKIDADLLQKMWDKASTRAKELVSMRIPLQ